MRAALLCLVFLAGCKVKNPHYCEEKDNMLCDKPDAAPMKCQVSDDCTDDPSKMICEAMECVQCTPADKSACGPTTPLCTMNTCTACVSHSDCPSTLCLPDGSCAAPADVAYFAANGTDNTNCTQGEKCTVFSKALDTNRMYIKVEGTHTTNGNILINRSVKVFGDRAPMRAKLSPPSGTIVTINGNGAIEIHDIEINGGNTPTIGISVPTGSPATLTLDDVLVTRNNNTGILVSDGTLTIRNSRIDTNQGGGINVSGTGTKYSITNNFIVANGLDFSTPSLYGGVMLATTTMGNKLQFNTIAFNRSSGSRAAGVDCVGLDSTAVGNIIYANQTTGPDLSDNAQKRGDCVYTSNLVSGANVGTAPHLGMEAPLAMPASYKLTTMSPMQVVNVLTTGCPMTDFEGQARPSGAGCELGADELP